MGNFECGCGCENGPQCNETTGVFRCTKNDGHEGAHESYGMLSDGTRKYFTWEVVG